MASDLDTVLLRAFVTAARVGSISRAAISLGHTQPAVSQQLQRLERVVGRPLLKRTGAGVTLTGPGEALLPYAQRILSLSAEALADRNDLLTGHCGVGLMEDLVAEQLPRLLTDFARLHPEATLEVLTFGGPAMRHALEEGRIHVALCDSSGSPEPPRWSTYRPLAWALGPGVDCTADPLPLVMFSQPCGWRANVLAALEGAGRSWRVVFESTSPAAMRAAVRSGLGAAAMLANNVDPETAPPVGHGLPNLPAVGIGLVRGAGTEGDPLVDAVEAALRRMA